MLLSDHPFFVLDGSPQYNQWKLSALAGKKSIYTKDGKPQQALDALLDPEARLRAEIRWFPGCAPETAKSLVQFAAMATERLPANAASLPAPAVFNALVYALPRRKPGGTGSLAKALNDLGKYQSLLLAPDVFHLINADRKMAKFPILSNWKAVDQELQALMADARALAAGMVERLDDKEQGALIPLLDEKSIVSPLDLTRMRLKSLAALTTPAHFDQDKLLAELASKAKSIKESSLAAAPSPARKESAAEAKPPASEASSNAAGSVLYVVPASAPLFIPEFCTCCMAPTQDTETVFDVRYNAKLSLEPSIAQEFPLCPVCRSHRKQLSPGIRALCFLPILAAMLLAAVLGGFDRVVYTRLVLFIVFVHMAHLFQLKRTIQTAPIGGRHAGDWESVRIRPSGKAGENTLYGFANKQYAALFAARNGGKVTEAPFAKSMTVAELRDASPAFRKRFILCRVIAIVAAFLLLLVFP